MVGGVWRGGVGVDGLFCVCGSDVVMVLVGWRY